MQHAMVAKKRFCDYAEMEQYMMQHAAVAKERLRDCLGMER
jgi:hypothetical protein